MIVMSLGSVLAFALWTVAELKIIAAITVIASWAIAFNRGII